MPNFKCDIRLCNNHYMKLFFRFYSNCKNHLSDRTNFRPIINIFLKIKTVNEKRSYWLMLITILFIDSGRDMLKHGLTVTTSEEMSQIRCRFIFHVDAASIAKTSHMTAAWRKMVVKCLMKAEEMRLSSLAFPALGTGWLVI